MALYLLLVAIAHTVAQLHSSQWSPAALLMTVGVELLLLFCNSRKGFPVWELATGVLSVALPIVALLTPALLS